jgi:hypothetical protein
MAEQTSGAEILARIKPKRLEESTEIVLAGDLMDQWEKADAELAESREKDMAGNRLADGPSAKTKKLAQKVHDLEQQIAAQAMRITFRAMLVADWRTLCDNHPRRDGDILDAHAGYNRDAVLDEAVRMCMIEPVFADCDVKGCEHEDCGSWQQFVSVVPPGEWEELKLTANKVNAGVVDAPKSALASRILARRATG